MPVLGDRLAQLVGVVLGDLARPAASTRYSAPPVNSMPQLRPLKYEPARRTTRMTSSETAYQSQRRPTKSIDFVAVVEVVAEPRELAHQALPPARNVDRCRGPRRPRPDSLWPWLKNLNRRQPRHHRVGEPEEHRQVDQRGEAEREREALHHAGREDVEHDRGQQRHRVGRQAGVPGAHPAALDRDPHRLAVAHLVADALEVDDERVGGDADPDDQAGDAGQGQREARALAQQQHQRVRRSPPPRAATRCTTRPRPR